MATQIPFTNIPTTLIRDELGEASNAVSVLSKSPNVNKWGISIFGLAGVDPQTNNPVSISHFQDTRRASQRLSILAAAPYKMGDFRYYYHPFSRTSNTSPLYYYAGATSPYNYGYPSIPREGGTYTFWVDYRHTALKIVPVDSWITAGSSSRFGTYSSLHSKYIVREGLTFTVAEWTNYLENGGNPRIGTFEIWTDEGDGNDVLLKTFTIEQETLSADYAITLSVNGVPQDGSANVSVPWQGGSYTIGVTFSKNGIDWEYELKNDAEGVTNFTVGQVHTRLADSWDANNDGEFGVLFSENPNTSGLYALVVFEIRTLDGFYTLKANFRQDPNPIYL